MSRDTLHSRQAEYEKTLYRKFIRNDYCYKLDRIVAFLGKDRAPEDVFRSDIPALREYLNKTYGVNFITFLNYCRVGASFYNWMDAMEYVSIGFNPFRAYTTRHDKEHMQRKEQELNIPRLVNQSPRK